MTIFGNERRLFLADESETERLGRELARLVQRAENALAIYLDGDLGMGKTTLSRGLLRGLGHEGAVKSPTYTIVEPYENLQPPVYHFDLYRLKDPEELEFMGIRDYFNDHNLCLVEWPERGEELLPTADLTVYLESQGNGRSAILRAGSKMGADMLNELEIIGPEDAHHTDS
ncbi:MAG: tRNA threonylcarbamoyladenosine biosynthesis protein TsaE [Marinobacter psychrophilus]|jgi:tRNA threonylcarbamoyladenosine biosynthesis protein TsaE